MSENLKEKDLLEVLDVYERIILKRSEKSRSERGEFYSCGSG
jgi:hypothetical protein